MAEMKYGNEYRMILLCVDAYEDAVLKGRYYHPTQENGVQFHSTIGLLLSIEKMLEQMQFPQAFTRARTFAGSPVIHDRAPGSDLAHTGILATFQIRILFRQNASWQGIICWLDGRKEERFRSVLELLILVDSALKESLRG